MFHFGHEYRENTHSMLAAILHGQTLIITNQQELLKKMAVLDDKLAQLTADVAAQTTVFNSAVAALNGIPALIATAVTAALAAGATPAELQAVTDANSAIEANNQALAAAISANTVVAPQTPSAAVAALKAATS
jgi:hypothetical protein